MEDSIFIEGFVSLVSMSPLLNVLFCIILGVLLGYLIRHKTKVEFPESDELNTHLQLKVDSKMKSVYFYFLIIVLFLNYNFQFDEASHWLNRKILNSFLIILFLSVGVAEKYYFLYVLRKTIPESKHKSNP